MAEKRTSVGVAAIVVGDVGAKCSHFCDNFTAATGIGWIVEVLTDKDDAELGADGEGTGEHGEDHVRVRRGGDVEIFRFDAEEDVAHAAARKIRLVAGSAKADDDVFGGELGGRVVQIFFHSNKVRKPRG